MRLQSRTITTGLWQELANIMAIARGISDEPVLLYGTMALNYYGSAQVPVDIDLLVPDCVESQLIDGLESLGYIPEPNPYLGTIYKLETRSVSVEIHDFQKYSDDFFLFASPQNGCKWEELLAFSVAVPDVFGVRVPTLELAFVMYAKYLNDWVYLDSVSAASPEVRVEVDAKWPRLLRSFADLLNIIAVQVDHAERFLLSVFNIARKLSLVPALSKLPYYLQLLERFDRESIGKFCDYLDNAGVRDLVSIMDDQTRTKRCGDHLYLFRPSSGNLIEVSGIAADVFAADLEFEFPTPHAASIQITSRCNLTCDHCAFTHQSDVMDVKVFNRVLTHLASLGVFEVNLGEGGEATLHPQLADLVRLAHDEYGFVVNVTSNLARPLSDELLDVLDSGIASVHCSFDEMHFNSADYKSTLGRNLQALRDRVGCRLGINIGYKSGELPNASRSLDDALNMFADVVDQVSILKVSKAGSPCSLSEAEEQQLESMFCRINDAGLRIGFHSCDHSATKAFNSISGLQPVAGHCPAWKEFIYIDAFGRVSPCGIRESIHVFGLGVLSPEVFATDPLSEFRDCQTCAYDCN